MLRLAPATMLVFGLAVATCAQAARAVACPAAAASAAEDRTAKLADWPAVAAFHDRFQACDDGAIAEGLSDAIGRLLSHPRPEVDVLRRLARSHPGLEAFVQRHVDASLPDAALARIAEQLPSRCDARSLPLCRRLAGAARHAMAERPGLSPASKAPS